MHRFNLIVICLLKKHRHRTTRIANRTRAKDTRRTREIENYDDDDDDNTAEDEAPDGRRYPLRNRRHTNVYQGKILGLILALVPLVLHSLRVQSQKN